MSERKIIYLQCPACRKFMILVPVDGTPAPEHRCIGELPRGGFLVPVEITINARVKKPEVQSK